MNYTNHPALTFLAVSCLAVATVGAFHLVSTYERPRYDTITIDAESITMVFATDAAQANLEPNTITMPTQYITAVRDPLSGPEHKCSAGARFEPRSLVQGTGSVRGFCP